MAFQKGDKHPKWKDDNIKYGGLHDWLRNNFGRANHCESLTCEHKSKNFGWCLKKGKLYSRNIDNYIQLCYSCHMKYDYTDKWKENLSEAHKGNIPSQETKNKMIESQKLRWKNPELKKLMNKKMSERECTWGDKISKTLKIRGICPQLYAKN